MTTGLRNILILALGLLAWLPATAGMRVPAFTAYLEPEPDDANVSAHDGISGWTNPALKVRWFGDIKVPGTLACQLELILPAGQETRLQLTVAGQSREATARGTGSDPVTLDFGSFAIPAAGYQSFTLASLNPTGRDAGQLQALLLDGPAVTGAHFNLDPRRNAASVHLIYPVNGLANIDAFYCEVTGVETPVWTYFAACGWHRGYFGMQVNRPTERRIIFSVWDSGKEGVDRNKVADADRTRLLAKGQGVYAGDFGNEGTGGHSHLVYPWRTGEKQRFLVTAKPTDTTHTVYTGYWFQPELKQWQLISSWLAPKDGAYLHGLYSFSENFEGSNGEQRRKALYGNQWLHTTDGQWHEQTTATFSHDPTGKTSRLDRFMGVEAGQFFLSNGGFIPGFTSFGTRFDRPSTDAPPADIPAAFLSQN